jgi:hypothetical protein
MTIYCVVAISSRPAIQEDAMPKIHRYGLAAVLCVSAAAAGVLVSYRLLPQNQPQPQMRPFVAQSIEKHFGPDGNLAPLPGGIVYITIARKSDGSQIRFFPHQDPDGSFALARSIFDVSGKEMKVLDDIKSVTTYYYAPIHVAHHIATFESCPPEAQDPTAPRSTRLGYEVVEIKTEHTSSRGIDYDDRWVAPALNCFALAETYTSSLGSRNDDEVINVFEGEPPESWFTAPSGYTERSPSQLAAAFAARFPGHALYSDQVAAMADRAYRLHRNPQQ